MLKKNLLPLSDWIYAVFNPLCVVHCDVLFLTPVDQMPSICMIERSESLKKRKNSFLGHEIFGSSIKVSDISNSISWNLW